MTMTMHVTWKLTTVAVLWLLWRLLSTTRLLSFVVVMHAVVRARQSQLQVALAQRCPLPPQACPERS